MQMRQDEKRLNKTRKYKIRDKMRRDETRQERKYKR